jgi:hypothetical protein
VQQPCSNPSKSLEMLGNVSAQKYSNLQVFCKLWKPPGRRRLAMRFPQEPEAHAGKNNEGSGHRDRALEHHPSSGGAEVQRLGLACLGSVEARAASGCRTLSRSAGTRFPFPPSSCSRHSANCPSILVATSCATPRPNCAGLSRELHVRLDADLRSVAGLLEVRGYGRVGRALSAGVAQDVACRTVRRACSSTSSYLTVPWYLAVIGPTFTRMCPCTRRRPDRLWRLPEGKARASPGRASPSRPLLSGLLP